MAESITDANDVIVKIGSGGNQVQGGGTEGVLIIDEVEIGVTKNKEKKYGVGNESAQGRTSGNREVDVSFTHIGQNATLAENAEDGDFEFILRGDEYKYELDHVDGDFTVTVSDGGDYEIDFDGDALTYDRVDN